MVTRRQAIAATLATAIATTVARRAWPAQSASRALKRIHERIGGRLGVDVLDSQSGLLGVSGLSGDVRDLEEAAAKEQPS